MSRRNLRASSSEAPRREGELAIGAWSSVGAACKWHPWHVPSFDPRSRSLASLGSDYAYLLYSFR
ncbi:hypothetical protein HRbin36_00994 [bacterium HR36]|nr:hypothetical protein HRbin36_00994 [bacterium HR36]